MKLTQGHVKSALSALILADGGALVSREIVCAITID